MEASAIFRLLKRKRFEFRLRTFLAILVAVAAVFAANCSEAEAAWKFVVYGDTRSNDSAHRSVLRSMAQNTPDYRFIINVGDVVADGTNASQWNIWQNAVNDELGGAGQNDDPPKYMAVPGNHDNLDSSSGSSNWSKYLPGQQQYGNNGAFFVLDHEDVRIILLNSEDAITGSQRDMLLNAIDNNPKTWLFAVWHRPIFPFGAKSYEDAIHDNWGVPLYEGGADIIFAGHAHYYARSKKLKLNGQEHPPEDASYGTAQVISGNGGAPPYEVDPGSNAYMMASGTKDYGYTELTVDGDSLYLRHITSNGTVIDETTYAPNPKSVAATPCEGCTDALSTDGTLTTGEWLASSSGRYRLHLQSDGNLVLRDQSDGQARWSSGTNGQDATRLVLQGDSNLVLYTAAGAPVWASKTVGSGATELRLNDDGTLALYQGTGVVWSMPSNSSTGGKILSKQGSFSWDGTPVDYTSTGGLTNGGLQQTPAKAGDYEIVSFGASHGSGTGKVNEYFDQNKMINQGFQAIGVRGEEDKKVEMWIRKNSGQNTIDIPADARVYDFLILDGNDIQIDLGSINVNTVNSDGDSYQVPDSGGSGLKVLSYFSDDSGELTDIGNGTLTFQEWGFGDGDALATALYAPGQEPPSNIDVFFHDGGGRQYVGIMATYAGSAAGADDGDGAGTGNGGGDTVDAGTLNNKIMAGYQGWFNADGDGAGRGWRHWADGSGNTPDADNITIDMWPDIREYDANELFDTSFKYSNGANAGLYSAYTPKTVERHVKWMQDYGIDGVFVQRFIGEATGSFRGMRDRVLQNVRAGAEKYGRVFANMYDISGGNAASLVNDIKNDWMHLVDDLRITESSRYLHHNGRPVLSIWGFNCNGRPGSAAQALEIIRWLTTDAPAKYRVTVKLGVDDDWRTDSADWQAAYRNADIISPWAVGRYNDNSGADRFRNNIIEPDLADLNNANIDYMPVVFPGFSWWNLKGEKFNHIKRNGGRFFWRQFYNAIDAGANMVYVAMVDEVD
jgi:predicted phosphodiesterase